MAVLRSVLAILTLSARAHPWAMRDADVSLSLEPQLTGGFLVSLHTANADDQVIGHIGRTLVQPYTMEDVEGGVVVHMGVGNLTILTEYDDQADARAIKVRWDAPSLTRLEDCIDFGLHQWYGGPMQVDQIYPIQNAPRTYSAYISTEQDNGAIVERYWLNSAGHYFYVHPEVPLFVDYNNLMANHLCLGAQLAEPYSSRRDHTPLSYDFWILPDVKQAHQHAITNYLGHPSDVPDFRMVQHPIWSTWAQFSRDINESNLLEFAQEIVDYGFNNSQFEIDDSWETCYGSLTVDEEKFSNFSSFVQELKSLGYRVTLWVHPFINRNCEPWYSDALSQGYLAVSETGSTDTSWWNGNGTDAAYVDFTNPDAAEWWYQKIVLLRDTYQIDSFKFDAGESSFAPQISIQNGELDLQPHHIVEAYVRTCARFGGMVEVRAGFRTQDLPIFVRMVDRDSIWGNNNGLSTVITTALQMSLNGYPYILPDMVGGNGYNLDHEQASLPTKELFIRWVQATTFLPAIQFSFAPWNFDNETVEISRKFAEIHAEYAAKIYEAMEEAARDGTPVIAPLWWLDPADPEALVISDEFLVGEDILVAPVLREGVTSRDVYLPAGTWLPGGDSAQPLPAGWVRDYPAPLDTLPYFIRQSSAASSLFATAFTVILAFLLTVLN